MWKITLLRMMLIIILGIVLFSTLLFVTGRYASIRLKRRNRKLESLPIPKDKVITLYFLILISTVIVGFLLLKYYVRGEL